MAQVRVLVRPDGVSRAVIDQAPKRGRDDDARPEDAYRGCRGRVSAAQSPERPHERAYPDEGKWRTDGDERKRKPLGVCWLNKRPTDQRAEDDGRWKQWLPETGPTAPFQPASARRLHLSGTANARQQQQRSQRDRPKDKEHQLTVHDEISGAPQPGARVRPKDQDQ